MHVLYDSQPENYRRDRPYGFGDHLSQDNAVLKSSEGEPPVHGGRTRRWC